MNFQISDNSQSKPISDKADLENLLKISNISIDALIGRNKDILFFPEDLKKYGDKIGEQSIFDLKDNQIFTGNIMGFVGVNNTELKIKSRFTSKKQPDFFLHYMLERVFAINLFNLKHSSANENIFDFLLFLFPYYLKKAFRQGIFKEYQNREYNNANVHGIIDITRHIQRNIPFAGNIAYNVREHSKDNYITQLIRHTIEFISEKEVGVGILNNDQETQEAIAQIRNVTPNYNKRERRQILYKNSRPFAHPFYMEYDGLQKICKQILTYQGMRFGKEKDKIYGILFDGAWLWEEYLHTILTPLKLKHPENKTGKGRIYLFIDNTGSRYPDFCNDEMVLDAKYKRLRDGKINRDDMHQIISYMHVLETPKGGFVCPTQEEFSSQKVGSLKGFGGDIFVFKLSIPQKVENYGVFQRKIKKSEQELVRSIQYFFLERNLSVK